MKATIPDQPRASECNVRFPYNVNLNLLRMQMVSTSTCEIMRIEEFFTMRRGSSATLCRSINTIDTAVIRGSLRNAERAIRASSPERGLLFRSGIMEEY
ncbi:hypothetical protein CEXT_772551 [Caerostris extrusa]|uniref:Uncharacterized protein n=1 Tax=Caerostris extrusa TaxID=172846 RepID=A0AAV4NT98_CAEEX|nr:hypothetical protein CEXT_772551 [Caerostris extrusa]